MSMKTKFFVVAAVSTLMLASAAIGGQPVPLSDAQMDRVAAGAVGSATSLADALGNLQADTVTLTLGSADSANRNAFAMALSAASASSLLSPAAASSRSSAIARAP
jgi:hypothetical protein